MDLESKISATGDSPSSREQLALRASEARFRDLIANNADGMIVVSGDGVILFANPAAESLLGRSRDTLVGTSFGNPIVPGETVEIDVFRAGWEPRVAEMRVVQTVWNDHPAALASLRDITDRKRLEDELNRRVRELAEADHQKNTFLAMLAHELRNPLAPVRNAAEMMRLRPDDPQTVSWARGMIEQQVEHMTHLVDDLLDVSRITRGKIQLRKSPIALARVVQRAVNAAGYTFSARGLDLKIMMLDETLGVVGDATRLEQIVANLLSNASKFSEMGGEVRVLVSREDDHARLVVEDDGIGIAPEMLPRVFDLFAQGEGTIDRSRGGLGIGLTLVRSLVELHGGYVTAESEGPGLGSRFAIYLPAIADPIDREDSHRDEVVAATSSLRVLVVDDNLQAAESMGVLLKFWGHESRQAHDGREAILAADQYNPQVVLLDIGLPVLNGYEVARQIRSSLTHENVLLVAITGYGQEDDRRRAREAGFDHHMVKPVDLDELRHLLANPETLRAIKGISR